MQKNFEQLAKEWWNNPTTNKKEFGLKYYNENGRSPETFFSKEIKNIYYNEVVLQWYLKKANITIVKNEKNQIMSALIPESEIIERWLNVLEDCSNDSHLLDMQYYMEYCCGNEYVTPKDWILYHKHF
jgi:hypothetical protein